MAKHSLVFEKFPLRRGSRRGYNADVDDKPHSPDPAHPCDGGGDDDEEECEEDRTIIDSKQNGSNCRIQFYSHIKPKRRRIDDSTSRQQQKHSPWQSNKEKKKRTHYWTTTLTHPDIDLSLVPLSSSTELDQQTVITTGGCGSAGAFAYLSTIPTTTTTTTTTTCSSSSSFSSAYLERKTNGRSRTTFKDDDRGKKENFEHTNASSSSSLSDFNTKARPLAVVDYGSIELDMSGTLLDSIYKIVPPPTSSGGGGGGVEGSGNNGVGCTNWTGGRKRHRFSFAHSNYESIQSNRRKRSLAGDEEVNEASCDNLSSSPLFPYLNQGSTNSILSIEPNLDDTSCAVQVQATSPTLVRSGHPAHETTSSLTHEGGRTTTETQTAASINKECFDVSSPPAIITRTKMVEAGRMVHGPLPTISNVPTTLEAAISFSPFARYEDMILGVRDCFVSLPFDGYLSTVLIDSQYTAYQGIILCPSSIHSIAYQCCIRVTGATKIIDQTLSGGESIFQ